MRLKGFLWGFGCLAALALVGFLLALRSYQLFTQEELLAVVQCDAPPRGSACRFILWIAPVSRGIRESPRPYGMLGDQWSVGGEVLKWHPWVNLLGLRSCYRLTRLSSRYLKAETERQRPRSVYDLNGGTAPLWEWLYRFQRWIPFVEAVYGNATYVMAQPGGRWGVYVTLSGYLVKPLPPQ